MYSTDLSLTLRSHCCLTWLHSAHFCIKQTLFSHYCTSQLNSTKLSLFIHSTDKALTVNICYWAFKVHSAVFLLFFSFLKVILSHASTILFFLCLLQTLLSFLTVIIVHQSSILLFSCILPT